MVLTKHEMARMSRENVYDINSPVFQYRISGLPAGEHALIAEFPNRGWRILRWNAEWHGNWTGSHLSADAAVEALREEMLEVARTSPA